MCGLTGFWDSAADRPAAELERLVAGMADAIASRGPDDRGTFADERAGLALGHRRLSILDLSAEGHQPMATPDGRHVLVYNGEVYNYRALRDELAADGVTFRGHSDSELVLHALVRWGIEAALERFVGMFAFALWDAQERELLLARDRLGIKPLYWGELDGTLYFGSELKALRRHPDFSAQLDRGALTLFFRHSYVPAPYSIYAGIHKLRPGRWLRFRGPCAVEEHAYWDADRVRAGIEPRDVPAEEALEELEHELARAVRDRLVSDVPLGAFLSGGVDSSTVVALMRRESNAAVRTFTIGFHEEGYDEAAHARAVSEHLGSEHHEFYVRPADALAVVPSLPEHWDEPFADSSQIPTYLVSRFARERVTVCLSGDGGDELFGGYPRYFLTRRLEVHLRRVPRPLRGALAACLRRLPPGLWDAAARRFPALARHGLQPGWAGYRVSRLAEILGSLGEGSVYRSMISHWKEPADLVLGGFEPPTAFTDGAGPAVDDPFERMMLLDTGTYLPDDILCKVDRASMAHGLEARVPLLDHRFVERVWSFPRALRVGPDPGKGLLRALLARHVPRALFERPKMGFGVPIADWLRGPLRPWCEELLDERRLREAGELDPAPIRARWKDHASGRLNWGYYLWDVLVYQAWRERWMEPEAAAPALSGALESPSFPTEERSPGPGVSAEFPGPASAPSAG